MIEQSLITNATTLTEYSDLVSGELEEREPEKVKVTRFSGADWADQLRTIEIVGVGGIGSWLALNLSRIGHDIYVIDPDIVDRTNVTGGQMYRTDQVGEYKASAVLSTCRQFGCDNSIMYIEEEYDPEGSHPSILMSGLDNMEARKEVFKSWKHENKDEPGALFMDGRLTMEMMEVFTIRGGDYERMEEYEKSHLFSDEEADILDCTTKQSTFSAMGIASLMTATLCNFLTNIKLDAPDFREVPFYQRIHYPSMTHTIK